MNRMLELAPSPEDWYEMKSAGLSMLLGKEHDMVMHAIIQFFAGGGLHQYYYPQKTGYAIATKELIDELGEGPQNDVYESYELCMFSKVPFDLSRANDENSPMGQSHGLLSDILNAMARYSFQACLNPNETMEFPESYPGLPAGKCLILDAITRNGKGLEIGGREFGLMVAIVIHRDEMRFAQTQGGALLIEKLKKHGVYPYSDLNRRSVV